MRPASGQAKPVLRQRARGHDPQLHEVLGHDVQLLALGQKMFEVEGSVGNGIQRVVGLQRAEQDVPIDKHEGSQPVGINALAADSILGEQGRRAVVSFGPGPKLTHPFRRVGLLKVRRSICL